MEPSIELDELMERIRAATRESSHGTTQPGTSLPPLPEPVPAPPPAIAMGSMNGHDDLEFALAEAASMLPRARRKTEVGAGVPRALHSLFRNQGGFNGILLEAVSRLLDANRQLQDQNTQLQARLAALEQMSTRQHDWSAAAHRAQERQREWMQSVESLLFHADSPHAELIRRVKSMDGHAERLEKQLKNLQAQLDDLRARHENSHEQYRQTAAHQETLSQNARRLEERQHNDAGFLRNQLWLLQRLIPSPPSPADTNKTGEPASGSIAPGAHDLDALYLAFEEVMRGSRSAVKSQAAVYLPYIVAANAGTPERPVLDLGCGRGEWLEILIENGKAASGVDLNTCMVDLCRERNLPVTQANAIDHLRALPDASYGAITAFHFIEHLPFPVLVGFLRECRRVVQPGGVVIFETPNPYNVLVGSGYFYHDFTHQRPLPPTSTKFLVEHLGFSKVEVLPLHPWDDSAMVHGEGDKALEWRFNDLFYGPQDYALIATP